MHGVQPKMFEMEAVGAIGLARVFRNEQSRGRLVWELLPFAILAAYHFPIVPAGPDGAADRDSGAAAPAAAPGAVSLGAALGAAWRVES